MTRLPRVTARQIISVLEKLGFTLARQSGSHMIYKNAAGKRATIPFHGAKVLHPKVLKIFSAMPSFRLRSSMSCFKPHA
jgi:predicted RNA binding protein YcfA (HicA-like mRNA interferase family)